MTDLVTKLSQLVAYMGSCIVALEEQARRDATTIRALSEERQALLATVARLKKVKLRKGTAG